MSKTIVTTTKLKYETQSNMIESLIFYFLVLILVPMIQVFSAVERMKQGKGEVLRVRQDERKVLESLNESYRLFLDRNKFIFYSSFQYENVRLSLWKQDASGEPQRFFILYHNNNPEFVTQFNEEVGLTSCGHASAFMYPRPYGAYIQSKKTKNIDQLWQYHYEGERFLIEEYPTETSLALTVSIEDRFNLWIIKQGKYISGIPFFWTRAPYWFYIKRFIMRNVSIRQQHTKRKK